MPLSLDQLRAFIAVAEHGSFTAAARELGKAQSSVSEMISTLEIDSDVELFDRRQRKPPLTEAGLSLLREAKSVLAACEDFVAKSGGFSKGIESRLTLVYDPTALPFDFLKQVLHDFQARYPFIELEILCDQTSDAIEMVKSGRADLGVVLFQGFGLDGIDSYGVGEVHLKQVAAPDHDLAQLPVVTHAELRRYHKLAVTSLTNSEPLHHQSVTNRLWYLDNVHTLLDLVKSGFGWSLMPIHMVEEDIRTGTLTALKVDEQKQMFSLAVEFIWHRKHPLGQSAIWLREALSKFPSADSV